MDSEQIIPDDALTPITSSGDLSQSINPIADELIISASKVNKYFGDKHVLKDVDFEVHKREVVALIGPSGSGKSTDRKSTRLNSSHVEISYAVFCLKKKKPRQHHPFDLSKK